MRKAATDLSPTAARVRSFLDDPPREGWTRRSFLKTLSAAAALPLLADAETIARAQQRTGGRIRITDLKIQRLRIEKDWGTYEDYVGGRRGGRTGGGAIVEIFTDQGLVGIGPAIAPAALDPIKTYLAGKDPFDINRHMAVLYAGGREGGLRLAGSRPTGIEIALWDLIGKAADQPLYKLWGGTRDRIVPYSSMFRLGPPSERAETAVRLKGQGWKAIKLKSHYATMKEDVAQIEAVRRACGPDFIVATDGNKAGFSVSFQGARGVPWTFKRALDTAKEFERLDVYFLEEPLPRFDFDRLAELNRLTSINLAGGEEQNAGVHEFRWLLEKGCFDIIQPEIDTQGPAVLQKVAVIAESMEKLIMPHLGDGRLSTVCDMHLVATWPNAPLLEVANEGPEGAYEHSYAVFEEPIALTRDGYFDLPQRPGLGVAIRKELYEPS